MVGVYVRVSTLQQKDNYSVETQRERGIAFASRRGEEYVLYDEALSGKNLERPEFLRLLHDVETKKLSAVWVIEASRLTRDVEDAQAIKRIFKKNKVELYVNDQHIDLSTSESILQYQITSAVSEYERSKIIDRVIRSRRKQIDDGEQAFCSIFGYDYVFAPDGKKIWQINETEAEVIKKAFQWYSEGHSYLKIANRLTDAGYQTKQGKTFSSPTIRSIICRPEYFGLTKNTKGELIPSKVYTPILDPSLRSVLQQQTMKRERVANQFREAKSLLGGLVNCSQCGTPYYLNKNTAYLKRKKVEHTYIRYLHLSDTTAHRNCNNTLKCIDAELLETFVDFCYRSLLRNKLEIKALIEAKEKEVFLAEQELVSQLEATKKRLDEVEVNRKKLISGIAKGLYTPEDIQDSIQELNVKKSEIEAAYGNLKGQLDLKREDVETIIRAFADRNIEEFETSTRETKRDIYVSVIRSLLIDNGWVRLTFITDRSFECPAKRIPQYIKAIQVVGEKPAFEGNRYRWDELK